MSNSLLIFEIVSVILLLIVLALVIAGTAWKYWLKKKLDSGKIDISQLDDDELASIERDAVEIASHAERVKKRAARLRLQQMQEARRHQAEEGLKWNR